MNVRPKLAPCWSATPLLDFLTPPPSSASKRKQTRQHISLITLLFLSRAQLIFSLAQSLLNLSPTEREPDPDHFVLILSLLRFIFVPSLCGGLLRRFTFHVENNFLRRLIH